MIINDIPSDTKYTVDFDSKKPRFTVAYWSTRGLGAPIRMMLCAKKMTHEVVLYDLVDGPNEQQPWAADWYGHKAKLSEIDPLINLPFVVDCKKDDDHVMICQSNAVLAYVGKEIGMYGETKVEAAKCDEFLCEIYDLRKVMFDFVYKTDGSSDAAKTAVGNATKHLDKLEMHLSKKENKTFLVGNKMSAPDFPLFEMLDQFQACCEYYKLDDFYASYPSLKEFKTGFEQLRYVYL